MRSLENFLFLFIHLFGTWKMSQNFAVFVPEKYHLSQKIYQIVPEWPQKNMACMPGLWLAETFSTSHLKPLNGLQQNSTGSKISTSSTKFVFFGPMGKTRWPPWPLIGWDIFDFSYETAERNSMKLDRKQDLNVLYQVCVFGADRKNKMAALASDWLGHFRLLLWNRWTEFNETWQEARS